ncbi:S8 family serine peptidase [Lysobacter enzymogenes]|uniref:S8 family serine peptidase n=1 Tax=Lysobacter enzymogenes TaxID=69 RepID=UPI00099DAEAC|nr:S8 family serine peptidase [Lysobacter enzymogenes]UZW61460.1 S8 family serine peptidase [Lysobacter enzymogenes]
MRHPIDKKTTLSLALLAIACSGDAQAQAQQGDPLYRYQWHLMNYGQSVLGDSKPAFAVDLGIDDLHDYNVRGKGVVVGVLDEGVEIAHPDLAANMVPNGSRNFDPGRPPHDPTPTSPGGSHGTAVAGIIGAVGWNGIGVRGVAPAARLKSFNGFGESGGLSEDKIVYSWWDGAESKDVAVSNNSWGGSPAFVLGLTQDQVAAYERPMSATRNGLGTVYVKAAGNGYASVPFFGFNMCGQDVIDYNVGCSQTGLDQRNNLFNVITVAAVNAAGKRSSYSSPGAALWVSGLGGEYGHQRKYSNVAGATRVDPAIVTTDLTGCAKGFNNYLPKNAWNLERVNDLDSAQSTIDDSCNYTGMMNGTSAASPTVAGVTALVLQANPKLSFRDVKYILAATARKVDPGQPAVKHPNGTLLVPGWVTNAAGRPFSNWYGYGLVDATAAVTRAGTFKPLPALVDSGWQQVQPDSAPAIGSPAAPATLKISIASAVRKVESIQLGWTTDYAITSGAPLPLQFVLISPSGTRSHVMPAMSYGSGDLFSPGYSIPFIASNAFLDEPGQGVWTLEVADVPLADAASKGALQSFKIRVLGH